MKIENSFSVPNAGAPVAPARGLRLPLRALLGRFRFRRWRIRRETLAEA